MEPVRLNAVVEMGPGAGSNAKAVVNYPVKKMGDTTYSLDASSRPYPRSGLCHQRLYLISNDVTILEKCKLPQVEKVPCKGWKEMSFTA